MTDLFDRRDWLMMGGAFLALMAVLIWRAVDRGGRPQVLGADPGRAGAPLFLWVGLMVIVILLVMIVVGITMQLQRRRKAQMKQGQIDKAVSAGPTVLLLPRSDAKPVNPDKVNLWDRLADALPHDEHISFELGGNEEALGFRLHGSENGMRAALTQIRSEWAGVQQRPVEPTDDLAQLPQGWHLYWCECVPTTWDKPVTPLSDDTLRAVIIELKNVLGQGRGVLQVIARNDFGTRKAIGEQAFTARAQKLDNAGVRAIRTREAKELEDRARRTFLQATIRSVGMADTLERAQGIARGIARAVSAGFGHSNPVRVVREGQDQTQVLARQMGEQRAWGGHELAHLAHLTGSDMLFTAPRLQVASARSLPADPGMRATPIDLVAVFCER